MSFPRYPEYKDSGIEWLGEVPAHWELVRLGYFASAKGGGTPPKDDLSYWNGHIPWITPKDMKVERLCSSQDFVTDQAIKDSAVTLIDPGHVLIVFRSGVLRHTLPVAINDAPTTVNQDIRAYDVRSRLKPEYFLRLIQGNNTVLLLEWSKQGATVESLESERVRSTHVPIPTRDDQAAIVSFLDFETARIDALIEEQQRLIELLKEKRQAVISHAVTKGLDPDVPMKDSGVEWLGEVPAHWEILSLRRVTDSIQTGGTPSKEPPSDEIRDGVEWFTPGDFGEDLVLQESTRKLSKESVVSGDAKTYPEGSVYVVGIGATLGKVGYVAQEASANQQINVLVPNRRVSGYFLAYSMSVKSEPMKVASNASTIGIINQDKTKSLFVAVPPLEEQKAIEKHLDESILRTDMLISQAEAGISLLNERRSALISAAITGKIDVRGWCAESHDNEAELPKVADPRADYSAKEARA